MGYCPRGLKESDSTDLVLLSLFNEPLATWQNRGQ